MDRNVLSMVLNFVAVAMNLVGKSLCVVVCKALPQRQVNKSDAPACSTPQALQQKGMLWITIREAVVLPVLSKLGIWLRHKQEKQNHGKEVVRL
jgi:hypothetical protein